MSWTGLGLQTLAQAWRLTSRITDRVDRPAHEQVYLALSLTVSIFQLPNGKGEAEGKWGLRICGIFWNHARKLCLFIIFRTKGYA